jgi:hypothetical protein
LLRNVDVRRRRHAMSRTRQAAPSRALHREALFKAPPAQQHRNAAAASHARSTRVDPIARHQVRRARARAWACAVKWRTQVAPGSQTQTCARSTATSGALRRHAERTRASGIQPTTSATAIKQARRRFGRSARRTTTVSPATHASTILTSATNASRGAALVTMRIAHRHRPDVSTTLVPALRHKAARSSAPASNTRHLPVTKTRKRASRIIPSPLPLPA